MWSCFVKILRFFVWLDNCFKKRKILVRGVFVFLFFSLFGVCFFCCDIIIKKVFWDYCISNKYFLLVFLILSLSNFCFMC